MIEPQALRRLALDLAGASEADHHGFPSYRVGGRIFATVGGKPGLMMVKLDPEDQHNLCAAHPKIMRPVPGTWGLRGATHVSLTEADEVLAGLLLRMAWAYVAAGRTRRRPGG